MAFTIRKYHDGRSSECKKKSQTLCNAEATRKAAPELRWLVAVFLPLRFGFNPFSGHMGFMMGKVESGLAAPSTLLSRFNCNSTILHIYSGWQWTRAGLHQWRQIHRDNLTPPTVIKRNTPQGNICCVNSSFAKRVGNRGHPAGWCDSQKRTRDRRRGYWKRDIEMVVEAIGYDSAWYKTDTLIWWDETISQIAERWFAGSLYEAIESRQSVMWNVELVDERVIVL